MQMTFRWFGPNDPIPLAHVRQIPGVRGVVSALYDVAVGDVWPRDGLSRLADTVDAAGLELAVIESIPVHEDIKLGRPTRDRLIAHYCESVRHMGETGVRVLCYNFMPVFDWMRTDLALTLADGSTALAYDDDALSRIDLSRGTGDLPGWATAYTAAELGALLAAYRDVSEERLWENLAYFLERVVPVAEEYKVKMGCHPQDPGVPKGSGWRGVDAVLGSPDGLKKFVSIKESPYHGLNFCQGTVSEQLEKPGEQIFDVIRYLGSRKKIFSVHFRNIEGGFLNFRETFIDNGSVDMLKAMRVYKEVGYDGMLMPDHVPQMEGVDSAQGFAFAFGYIKALIAAVSAET